MVSMLGLVIGALSLLTVGVSNSLIVSPIEGGSGANVVMTSGTILIESVADHVGCLTGDTTVHSCGDVSYEVDGNGIFGWFPWLCLLIKTGDTTLLELESPDLWVDPGHVTVNLLTNGLGMVHCDPSNAKCNVMLMTPAGVNVGTSYVPDVCDIVVGGIETPGPALNLVPCNTGRSSS